MSNEEKELDRKTTIIVVILTLVFIFGMAAFLDYNEKTKLFKNPEKTPKVRNIEIAPGHFLAVREGEDVQTEIEQYEKRTQEIEQEKIDRQIREEKSIIDNCDFSSCERLMDHMQESGYVDMNIFNNCMDERLYACKVMARH